MLFRDFARWVLLAVVLFVLVVLAMFVAEAGLFGPQAQSLAQSSKKAMKDLYEVNRGVLDSIFWYAGAAVPVVVAALAVHRKWYYAELNLPRRLRERIERTIATHIGLRPALLAAVNDPVAQASFVTPVVYLGYFDWVMQSTGLKARASASSLAKSLDTLKEEIGVVEAQKRELQGQAVTAHLVRGAILAAEASLEDVNSAQRRSTNEKALREFLAALSFDNKDLDALELAAKQSMVLGEEENAIGFLKIMADASTDQPLKRARALRLQAEILEKRTRPAHWDEARGLLITAIDEVLSEVKQASPERTEERAKAYRIRGEVQMKRERFTAARTALDRAFLLFQQLGAAGSEGRKSTQDALKRLEEAQRDRETPGTE